MKKLALLTMIAAGLTACRPLEIIKPTDSTITGNYMALSFNINNPVVVSSDSVTVDKPTSMNLRAAAFENQKDVSGNWFSNPNGDYMFDFEQGNLLGKNITIIESSPTSIKVTAVYPDPLAWKNNAGEVGKYGPSGIKNLTVTVEDHWANGVTLTDPQKIAVIKNTLKVADQQPYSR